MQQPLLRGDPFPRKTRGAPDELPEVPKPPSIITVSRQLPKVPLTQPLSESKERGLDVIRQALPTNKAHDFPSRTPDGDEVKSGGRHARLSSTPALAHQSWPRSFSDALVGLLELLVGVDPPTRDWDL
eukprot:9003818-Pyramimonas_sp.AAC.1